MAVDFKFSTFLFWPTSCPYCGSLQTITGKFGYCKTCSEEILKSFKWYQNHHYFFNNAIYSYYLLNWMSGKSDLLSHFLHNLKGKSEAKTWNELALFMSKKILANNIIQKNNSVLINCPSHSNTPDHAFFLAEGLSHALQIPHLHYLKHNKESQAQKKLNKTTRKEITFAVIQSLSDLDGKNIIFVDDIITTGATAQAAYSALNMPKNFIIMTFSNRSISF